MSIAKSISHKEHHLIRPNQELVAQSFANAAASLSLTAPVAGSFSRTALNYSSGAKSNLAAIVVGIATIVIIGARPTTVIQ